MPGEITRRAALQVATLAALGGAGAVAGADRALAAGAGPIPVGALVPRPASIVRSGSMPVMSRPASVTRPSYGLRSPARVWSSVDLPAPPLGFEVAFWDAHAGIVVDAPTLTGTAGVHFRRGPTGAAGLMARCASALDAYRLRHVISEATDEEQWNAVPRDVSTDTAVGEACAELATLVQVARRAAGGAFV